MPNLIGTYVSLEEYKSSLVSCLSRELCNSTEVLVLVPFAGANRQTSPNTKVVKTAVEVLLDLGHKVTVAFNPEVSTEIDRYYRNSSVNVTDLTHEHFIFSSGIADTKTPTMLMPDKTRPSVLKRIAVAECSYEAEAILPILTPTPSASFTIAGAVYSLLSVLPTSIIGRILLEASSNRHGVALSEIYSLFSFKMLGVVYDLHTYFDFCNGKQLEKHSDYVVFAQDCIAGDAYISELFGWPSLLPQTTRASSQLSAGDPFFYDTVFENKLPKGALKVKKPLTDRSQLIYPLNLFTKFKIIVDKSECDLCGICQNYCPNGSLNIGNRDIIVTKQCLSCFFCMDSCPKQAISVKRSL
jgi:Pyruvate/2-oxoacid:ferredoxin oxidoreductase delta subunit